MRILFLDDNLLRHQIFRRNSIGYSVDAVHTAQEAMECLLDEKKEYDLIMLDHDLDAATENQLNDDEEDGRYVVRKLVESGRHKDVTIVIHSLNADGRKNMKAMLDDAGYSIVHDLPFAWERFEKTENGCSFK